MADSATRATLVTVRPPNRRAFTLLLDNRIELGREADGIILVDARVSRRHVALEPGPDDTVMVIDLGSANGTTIDGVAVDRADPRAYRVSGPDRRHRHRDRTAADRRADRSRHGDAARHAGSRSSIDVVADDISVDDLHAEVLGVNDENREPSLSCSVTSSRRRSWPSRSATRSGSTCCSITGLVEAHVQAHRGRIVKHRGDGYMLCFRSARSALLSAIGLQRDLARQERVDRPRTARPHRHAHRRGASSTTTVTSSASTSWSRRASAPSLRAARSWCRRLCARSPNRAATSPSSNRAWSSCGESAASKLCGSSIGSSSYPRLIPGGRATVLLAFSRCAELGPRSRSDRGARHGAARRGLREQQQGHERGRVVDDDHSGRRDAERVPGRGLRGHDHGREEGRQRAARHVDVRTSPRTSRRTTSTCTGTSSRPTR